MVDIQLATTFDDPDAAETRRYISRLAERIGWMAQAHERCRSSSGFLAKSKVRA